MTRTLGLKSRDSVLSALLEFSSFSLDIRRLGIASPDRRCQRKSDVRIANPRLDTLIRQWLPVSQISNQSHSFFDNPREGRCT